MLLLLPADFFFKKIFQVHHIYKSAKQLDPDQDRHYVGPDLGPICLQRLSISRYSVTCILFVCVSFLVEIKYV